MRKYETGKKLFQSNVSLNDFHRNQITKDLYYKFPLVVLADSLGTLPRSGNNFDQFEQKLKEFSLDKTNISGENLTLSNIIITWNVFNHFNPYLKKNNKDWDNILIRSINDVLINKESCLNILKKIVHEIKDGHGEVQWEESSSSKSIPIYLEFINNQYLVTKTTGGLLDSLLGKQVIKINSKPIDLYVDSARLYHSGSTNATEIRKTLFSIMNSPYSPNLKFKFNGYENEICFEKQSNKNNFYALFTQNENPEDITPIEKNVYYLNLGKFKANYFLDKKNSLLSSKVIILDGRGYPSQESQSLIPYFLNFPDTSKWLLTPQIERPNSVTNNLSGYGWLMEPNEKVYNGQIIYLVNNLTRSYGESIGAYFENIENCIIVGQPSAGTNGNFNFIYLPGGYKIIWTGMKVLKHDGSQLHGVGIIPDVYVERTPEGIAAGRDEVLEKAIELAKAYTDSLSNSQ